MASLSSQNSRPQGKLPAGWMAWPRQTLARFPFQSGGVFASCCKLWVKCSEIIEVVLDVAWQIVQPLFLLLPVAPSSLNIFVLFLFFPLLAEMF